MEPADFLLPDGNENELSALASQVHNKHLEGQKLCMLYPMSQRKQLAAENSSLTPEYEKGILLEGNYSLKDVSRASQQTKIVVVRASDNLRQVMESSRSIFIFGLEDSQRQDFIHQRNSGMNHILMEIASRRDIRLCFSFADFLSLRPLYKARALGRLKQNLRIADKFRVRYSFYSFARDKFGMRDDMEVLGRLVRSNKK